MPIIHCPVVFELSRRQRLLDLTLEVLALDQIRDVILLILTLLALLHVLVALGKLAEGGEGVGAQLVEDARDKLGELLILTVAVDSESVAGDGSVNCSEGRRQYTCSYINLGIT